MDDDDDYEDNYDEDDNAHLSKFILKNAFK